MKSWRGRVGTAVVAVGLTWALVACSGSGGQPAATTLPPPPPTTTTIQPTSSSTNQGDIDAMIELIMEYTTVPGALVSISVPGHASWTREYGVADIATGAPLDPAMHFRIGGITSMFTCTLLYKLAQDEQLTVEAPISDFVAGFGSATLAQLCRNASGLPDYWENPEFYDRVAADPTRIWDPVSVASYASSSYSSASGGSWYPSSTNTVLVGVAIEVITQKSLRENMQEWIIGPMRLENTKYPTGDDVTLPQPAPAGYWQPAVDSPLTDYSSLSPSVGAGSGAMVSNLGDLARFVESVAEGRHVGSALTSAMRQTVGTGPDSPEWLRYGAGFFEMGPLVAGAGSIPGFAVGTVSDSDTGASFTVVFNNSTGGGQFPMFLAAALAATLLPDSAKLPFTAQEALYFATPAQRR